MKNFYSIILILILLVLSQNVSAQCYGTKFTTKIIDSTKTAIFTNTTTVTFHSYSWTFGDGQNSTVKSPSHQYSQSGTYWVELKGIDTVKKCFDTTGMWIRIGCKSDFSFSSDGTQLDYYTVQPGALKLKFDFGDGSPTSPNSTGSHTYSTFGTYNVCLTVQCTSKDSSTSCQSVNIKSNCIAAFEIPNKDSVGKTKFTFVNRSNYSSSMKYLWDLGNSGTANSYNVYERNYTVGTYNICLTITDTAKNCSDSICHTLKVGRHCDSGFSYSSKLDTLSYSYTGNATFIKLDFGDGKSATSKSGKHAYGKLGTYNVCLRAYCGGKDSSKYCVNITTTPIPCKAKFTKSVDTAQKFKIFLINTSSNTSTTTYQWNFGDGGSSTSRNPTHKYNTFGKFRVCLTVSDSGCSSTFCDTIGLDSSGKLLKAGFFEVVVIEQTGSISNKKVTSDFAIFPNPINSEVTIDLRNSNRHYNKVEVLDAIGDVCVMKSLENSDILISLDLQMIKRGFYFIKLSNDQGYSYMKVIKN